MIKDIDFTKLSNAEINLKMKTYDNEYEMKKKQIIELVHDLEELDILYRTASDELNKRGVLNDG